MPPIPAIFSALALLLAGLQPQASTPNARHERLTASQWTALPFKAAVGRLMIGAVGINVPTVEGSAKMYSSPDDFLPELDNGPAHYPGNALPWQNGTAIFSGHRVTHTHPFRNLGMVKLGQYIVLPTAHGRLRYRVMPPPRGHVYVTSGYGLTDSPCALRRACAVLHVSVDGNPAETHRLQVAARWLFRWHLKDGHHILLLACTPFHDKNYRLAVFGK